MVKFIGEDGFYPKWATQHGRWVYQRVLTTVRGINQMADMMGRPGVSREALVWSPKANSPFRLFRSKDADINGAVRELQYIPLVCSRCDWRGKNPSIEMFYPDRGPADWRLRCPTCRSVVEPDLHSVDWRKMEDFIL